MKKALFIVLMVTFMASSSFGQMGGRVSPDSPTDFNIGINKIHFFSEGTKVVGNLTMPKNYK